MLIDRRSFITLILGGLLFGKAAFASGPKLTKEQEKILKKLSLYLIGAENSGFEVSLGHGRNLKPQFLKDLSVVLSKYSKADLLDYDSLIKDIDSNSSNIPRSLKPLFSSLRTHAVLSFYQSPEGWAVAGYDGPPLKGYSRYNECSKS